MTVASSYGRLTQVLDAASLVRVAAELGWTTASATDAAVLRTSPALVVRVPSTAGPRIVKAHRIGTDQVELQQQVDLAAVADTFLAPVAPNPVAAHGRLLTCWPAGVPVDPARPEAAPWLDAARLLARLHRVEYDRELPAVGSPRRLARMLNRLEKVDHPSLRPAKAAVQTAAAHLPPVPEGEPAVCHGDMHLGQLVRCDGRWYLVDVDELGCGDPRWDLAWFAAWFAVGVLPLDVWTTLVDTYRAEGGTAFGPDGDPWPLVDAVARAATVHVAARSLVMAAAAGKGLDEVDSAFVDACVRMV